MMQGIKIINYLKGRDEPLNASDLFVALVRSEGRPVMYEVNIKKQMPALLALLDKLCEESRLASISVKKRGKYYCLPEWCFNGKLKDVYQQKIEYALGRDIFVALIDEQILVRDALRKLLVSFGGIKVIVEVDTKEMLMKKMAGTSLRSDIYILSSTTIMSDNNAALKEIKAKFEQAKVLPIATYDNEYTILKMMNDGANGYITKSCPPAELKKAINDIHKTHYYWDKVSARLWKKAATTPKHILNISSQRRRFLSLIVTGMSYQEIADEMGISKRTAENCSESLCENLGVANKNSLAIFAIKTGLVNP